MWAHRIRLSLLCFLIAASSGASLTAQTPPVTNVSLISEQSAVAPGSQFWVGIHLQLEPGWHTYWVNPGDSGEPPKVQWMLPAGWSASEIEWPVPERLTNPAGVDFGYNGQTTLLVRLKVPSSARPGMADINANVRWLVCKEMCIPQKGAAKVALRIAPKSAPDPRGKQQIAATRARLPKTMPTDWKVNVVTNPRQFLLNFMPGKKIDSADFFPEERNVIENATPQKLSATSIRAQLALDRADASVKPKSLKGVLVLNGSEAYALNVPIKR